MNALVPVLAGFANHSKGDRGRPVVQPTAAPVGRHLHRLDNAVVGCS